MLFVLNSFLDFFYFYLFLVLRLSKLIEKLFEILWVTTSSWIWSWVGSSSSSVNFEISFSIVELNVVRSRSWGRASPWMIGFDLFLLFLLSSWRSKMLGISLCSRHTRLPSELRFVKITRYLSSKPNDLTSCLVQVFTTWKVELILCYFLLPRLFHPSHCWDIPSLES